MLEDHFRASIDPTIETNLESIGYTNFRVGNLVTNLQGALDYLYASLYPNYIGTFATPGDLPLTANPNSYAYVSNDGDGKSAGYLWLTLDGAEGWQKRYDVDWSVESLLASFLSETHPLYPLLGGRNGGQTIYGGIATGENLEFNANSADNTGKIVTHNDFEPLNDETIDLGAIAKRFKDLYLNGALKDATITLTLTNLKDAFDHVALTNNPHSTSYNQLTTRLGNITVDGDASGSVDLSSSGDKTLTLDVADDSHSHTKSTLTNFDSEVYLKMKSVLQDADGLSFTFNDDAETLTPVQADVDTTEITDIESPQIDRVLVGSPTGDAWLAVPLEVELVGDAAGLGSIDSALGRIVVNVTNENIEIEKVNGINMSGEAVTIAPHATDAIVSRASHRLTTGQFVYIDSSALSVVTPEIKGSFAVTVLDANTFTISQECIVGGDALMRVDNSQLLYNAETLEFELRREYEELSHTEISNLDLNDDHLQYVRNEGRIGGQVIKGGSDNLDDLVLESTSAATKGKVKLKDSLVPFNSAAYSGSWSGVDLGTPSAKYNDIYTSGELKGARVENLTSTPASSGQNLGRLVYNTIEDKLYYDNGVRFKPLSSANIPTIIITMSNSTSYLVDLSSTIDADKTTSDYTWVLYSSLSSQQFHPSITRTSATSVTIESEIPLTGTFALKGI